MLLYLAATYKEYVEECKLNLYGTAPVKIPRPELYVVYTGNRTDVPEALRLSDLYEGTGTVDVEVKALRGNGTGDIVDQYVRFCRVSDEERKKHGRSRKAIEETLRRCMEEKGAPKGAHRGPDGRHVAIDPESHQKYGAVGGAGDDSVGCFGSGSTEICRDVEAVNAQYK